MSWWTVFHNGWLEFCPRWKWMESCWGSIFLWVSIFVTSRSLKFALCGIIMLSLWTRAVFTACEFPGTAILFQWPALKLQMGHKTHNNHYPFGGIWEWKDLKISGQTDCAEQNEWWVLWFRDILYCSGDRNVIKLHTASISENLLEIIKRRKDYLLSVNQT